MPKTTKPSPVLSDQIAMRIKTRTLLRVIFATDSNLTTRRFTLINSMSNVNGPFKPSSTISDEDDRRLRPFCNYKLISIPGNNVIKSNILQTYRNICFNFPYTNELRVRTGSHSVLRTIRYIHFVVRRLWPNFTSPNFTL